MTGNFGPKRRLFQLGIGRPGPKAAADWEVEHYLAEQVERLVAEGLSPEEAGREAERRFGDPGAYRRRFRSSEWRRWLARTSTECIEASTTTLVAALRTVRRQPALSLAIVSIFGLGIGANSAMFGILDRLLLRPPDRVADPGSVRRVVVDRGDGFRQEAMSLPDYLDLTAHPGLDGAAAYTRARELTRDAGVEATRVRAVLTTAGFFPLLGVQPVRGRVFTVQDDREDAQPAAVLAYEYWMLAFAGAPDVLGRPINLAGHAFTVIGVLPPGFTGVDLAPVDVWIPLYASESRFSAPILWRAQRDARDVVWINTVVRLAGSVPTAAAEAEATRLHLLGQASQIEAGSYPPNVQIQLDPLLKDRSPQPSPESTVARWLTAVSFLVLLIACANVVNLLLANATRRRHETALRLALGVSRRRIVAEAVLVSILLATGGGAMAITLARWGGAAAQRALLPGIQFPGGLFDPRVMSYTIVVAFLTAVIAGVYPALQSGRGNLTVDLGRRHGARGGARVREALTVAQAALCVVLLFGAGLFLWSTAAVNATDLGMDVDDVLEARAEWVPGVSATERSAFYGEMATRLERVPGVTSAAASSVSFQAMFSNRIRLPGADSAAGGAFTFYVSPTYFRTVGVAILEGRELLPTDGSDDPRVAVVSRAMADWLWPSGSAVGQCFIQIAADAEECTTVVGVAEDASLGRIQWEPPRSFYVPIEQGGSGQVIYVRVSDDAVATARDVTSILASASPSVRYASAELLRDRLDPQARSWKLGAAFLSVFGALALLVAAFGVYCVLAFEVSSRMRELGIRAALGARRARLLGGVLAYGARLVSVGVALGLLVTFAAAPRIGGLLYNVAPREPRLMVAVAASLLVVAALASLLPALTASRADPVEVLRRD